MGNFDKFSKKEVTGAKKKEAFRQEKKTVKKETAAYFKEKKAKQKSGLVEKKAVEPAKKTLPLKSATKQAPSPAVEAGKSSKILPVKSPSKSAANAVESDDGNMPLNKYVAHGGLCSRRDAAIMVKEGKIKVNGKVVLEPSYKVQPHDKVTSNGKPIVPKQHLVYILLNKPKDFLTTASDDQGRKTVMDIVKNATTERVYPVGRLDRNTTGVLLLTNDGDLAQQLTHPKFEIKKIYEVRLDKPVTKADLDQLVQGITLEDGPIAADAAAFADSKDRSIVGVEIHSGRNRIVRRMFEHLGYDVKNLDRVMFASLTKKNVERGKWRFLNEKEIRLLKYFQKSKK